MRSSIENDQVSEVPYVSVRHLLFLITKTSAALSAQFKIPLFGCFFFPFFKVERNWFASGLNQGHWKQIKAKATLHTVHIGHSQ